MVQESNCPGSKLEGEQERRGEVEKKQEEQWGTSFKVEPTRGP